MITLGIDPGAGGAIALYDSASGRIRTWDMPVLEVKKGKTLKKRVDVSATLSLFEMLSDTGVAVAILEDVGGLPGQSAPAAFNFGRGCGVLECALVATRIPFRPVAPSVWKAKMCLRGDKDAARLMASSLLPEARHHFARAKDDGRAEAALMALYGAQLYGIATAGA